MDDKPDVEPLSHKQKQENRMVERVFVRVKELIAQNANPALKPEDFDKFVRFMESARVIAASAILAAMFGAIYEYLALMGVADLSPARVVLVCACFFAVMFAWEMTMLFKWSRKAKIWVMATLTLVFAGCFLGLDRWALRWQLQHPPEITKLAEEVHSMGGSIKQLTGTGASEAAPRVTHDQPNIKEIQPVPGYLKVEFSYPHLPFEKVNDKSYVDVYFNNKGSTYVHDATMKGALYYVDFHGSRPPDSDPQLRKNLMDAMALIVPPVGTDIAPGDSIWNSYETQVLTQDVIDKIEAGTARLYWVSHAEWKTNGIPDHADMCDWLQPSTWGIRPGVNSGDPTKTPPVWHGC